MPPTSCTVSLTLCTKVQVRSDGFEGADALQRSLESSCGTRAVSDSLLTLVPVYAPNTAIELDGRGLPFVSPSGAHTLRRCLRRFGWQKLDGVREPEGSGARLGKAHHDGMERYLRGTLRTADDLRRENYPNLTPEQWTTLRRIVRAALASGAYPEPRPGVVVAIEQDLGIACEHASWRGRADAILNPYAGSLLKNNVVRVDDHKTTRDLAYALTDTTLPADPQAIAYASAVHERYAVAGLPLAAVGLQWTYVQTHGEAAVQVARGAMTPSEAHERMQALDAEVGATVRELARVRPRVLDLDPSWDQCDAFGGCPHRERCGERPIMAALSAALDHAPRAGVKGDLVSQSQQYTFAEKFAAPQAPTYSPPSQAASPAQAAPQAQTYPQPSQAAPTQPQGPAQAPEQMGPPPSLQAVFAQGQQPSSGPPAQGPQSGPFTGVNRPDGPANGYPELQAAARPPEAFAAQTQTPQAVPFQAPPQSAPASQHQPQAPTQPVQQPPAPSTWSQPPPQFAQAPAPVHTPQVAVGFVLLVGAALAGALPFRRVIPFEALTARASAVLRERQGVQDFRLVDYGHGPGLLATALQGALLEAQVGQGDALLVSHLGPEWQAVGAALRAQAAGVIQGTVG